MRDFFRLLLKPKFLVFIGLLTFVCVMLSEYIQYMDPLIKLLESERLTFKVGSTTFTAYSIVKILFFMVMLAWIVLSISDFASHYIRGMTKVTASNREIVLKTFYIILYTIAFMAGLNLMGIDPTTLTVFGGAVGIGIGIGLQKIASNFITGFILIFEKSIKVGDLIELNDGVLGYVKYTGARYTLIEAFSGKEIMIPNEDFLVSRVTNWTHSNTKGRVDLSISISYKSDEVKARSLMLEAAKEHPMCLKRPAPSCLLQNFGDGIITFSLRFWVADISNGFSNLQSDIRFAVLKKFKENNISMPLPQREVSIRDNSLNH